MQTRIHGNAAGAAAFVVGIHALVSARMMNKSSSCVYTFRSKVQARAQTGVAHLHAVGHVAEGVHERSAGRFQHLDDRLVREQLLAV